MGGRGGGAPFKTMQDRNTRSSVADHGKKKGNEIDEKQPGELLWKRRKVMHEARVCAVRREEKMELGDAVEVVCIIPARREETK